MEMELLGGPQTRVRSRNLSLFQESGYRVQDYSYEGIIGKIKSESMSKIRSNVLDQSYLIIFNC